MNFLIGKFHNLFCFEHIFEIYLRDLRNSCKINKHLPLPQMNQNIPRDLIIYFLLHNIYWLYVGTQQKVRNEFETFAKQLNPFMSFLLTQFQATCCLLKKIIHVLSWLCSVIFPRYFSNVFKPSSSSFAWRLLLGARKKKTNTHLNLHAVIFREYL